MAMRGSLANLPRMSMDSLNTREDAERALRIWLLSAVTREGGATYYRLAGRFQANGQTWEVLRRYSEFLTLRTKLIKFLQSADDEDDACPGCVNYLHAIKRFEFPKKHIFSSRNPAVVNYRVKALRSFMNLLASWAFSTAPKCPLCGGHAFDLVRNFVVDGAEPVTGSDMDYIRGSISVDAFTSNAERPSAFTRPSLDRRHSWIPASGSATLRAHEQQQQQQRQAGWNPSKSANNAVRGSERQQQPGWNPSKSANHAAARANSNANAGPRVPDAYDTFNDYLPARPVQRAKGSNAEVVQSTSKFSVQRPDEKQQMPPTLASAHKPESFLLYNDSHASFGSASMDATAAPRASTTSATSASSKPANNSATGLKSALRKPKSEPRSITLPPPPPPMAAHNDSDSFVSFSSTVATNTNSIAGAAPRTASVSIVGGDDAASRHSNMLSSPNAQPSGPFFDSFISDTVVSFSVEPVSSEYAAEHGRLESASPSSDDEDEDDLDDEIDITGVALTSPVASARPAAKSGENLWQPWELSRDG